MEATTLREDMKHGSRSDTPGQLAFISGKHAKDVAPAAWRFSLHDPSERARAASRFEVFRRSISTYDRHHLLSLTGLYALIGGFGPLQREGAYPETAELEFLQALCLSESEQDAPQIAPDEVLPFWRELATQCYVAFQRENDDASELEGLARVHAAYYRNPYGDEFFDRMVRSVSLEYDDRYLRDGSFSKAGSVIVELRLEIWRRFADHLDDWRISRTGTRHEVIQLLRRLTEQIDGCELDSVIDTLTLEELRQAAYQAAEDHAVDQIFLISPEWIEAKEAIGLPASRTLEVLSLSRIENAQPGMLLAANPVWRAPIVKLEAGYALYSPATLMSFPFHCLLTLLKGDTRAKARLEKVRGWFVEQDGSRMLRDAFPTAQIALGCFWQRSSGERVETDLAVLIADRLLIFEAKGALIPDRVRFGIRDATTQFLNRIWGKASAQGAALESHLTSTSGAVALRNNKGEVVMTIAPQKLKSISRFGISIEQFGPLVNAPDMLAGTDKPTERAPAAPCIILSELAQVVTLAGDELHRLHYLTRRSKLASMYQIVGDEMDIYTTYLQYGFSDLPEPGTRLSLLGASYSLGEYRTDGGSVQLPSDSALRHAPYFVDVLQQAREREPAVYMELGLLLLDMPYTQQKELESQLTRIAAKRPNAGDWPVIVATSEVLGERSTMAISFIDDRTRPDERRTVGLDVARGAGSQADADVVVSIVRVWTSGDPYDAIYVMSKTLARASDDV